MYLLNNNGAIKLIVSWVQCFKSHVQNAKKINKDTNCDVKNRIKGNLIPPTYKKFNIPQHLLFEPVLFFLSFFMSFPFAFMKLKFAF